LLEELLAKSESKPLEFKENAHTLSKIVQTIIAFANTAGALSLLESRIRAKTSSALRISYKTRNASRTP